MSMKFEEFLEEKGWLVYKTKGVRMLPMLHENQDLVVIRTPEGRLKKYDVALYKRGETYVLHRVIGVTEGGYDIRGDNTYAIEKVPEEAVIGVLIFVGLTAYDSQKIKRMLMMQADMGETAQKVALMGALSLYLDFINLFLYLLRLFGRER